MTLRASDFTRIPTQRMLSGFVGLFPLPEAESSTMLRMFLDVFERCRDDLLRAAVAGELAHIWRAADDEMREGMFFLYERIYSAPVSLPLLGAAWDGHGVRE